MPGSMPERAGEGKNALYATALRGLED
jgi:hypothetical protein